MQIKLFFVLNQKFLCVYVNVHKFNHDFSCILAIFAVSLFTREWIEISIIFSRMGVHTQSPSLRGSGLKYELLNEERVELLSPSLRGSGLK